MKKLDTRRYPKIENSMSALWSISIWIAMTLDDYVRQCWFTFSDFLTQCSKFSMLSDDTKSTTQLVKIDFFNASRSGCNIISSTNQLAKKFLFCPTGPPIRLYLAFCLSTRLAFSTQNLRETTRGGESHSLNPFLSTKLSSIIEQTAACIGICNRMHPSKYFILHLIYWCPLL